MHAVVDEAASWCRRYSGFTILLMESTIGHFGHWQMAQVHALSKYIHEHILSNYIQGKVTLSRHARFGASCHIKQDHRIANLREAVEIKIYQGSQRKWVLLDCHGWLSGQDPWLWLAGTSAFGCWEYSNRQPHAVSKSHVESHCARVQTAGIGLILFECKPVEASAAAKRICNIYSDSW